MKGPLFRAHLSQARRGVSWPSNIYLGRNIEMASAVNRKNSNGFLVGKWDIVGAFWKEAVNRQNSNGFLVVRRRRTL